MRILLMGPTYPFRGGIAYHTTLLCRALRQRHEVKLISFKRQSPQIFYRGQSDRDPSRDVPKADPVDYLIDLINPLSWFKAAEAIAAYRPHKIIVPWWASFWVFPFWTILMLCRNLPSERILLCHNVLDHESHFFTRFATHLMLSRVHRVITHSKQETRKLQSILKGRVEVVTGFLPTFAELAYSGWSRQEAKQILALTGPVLLFFGLVRGYKGLDVLLQAMPQVLEKRQVTLLIVGEFWQDKKTYLRQIREAGMDPSVRIIDRYVPNEEMGLYFTAADLVVQPYLSASGSAVSQLAYGFDRPVIATTVGSLPEVIEDGVNGRLVRPGDPAALAEAITSSLDPAVLERLQAQAVQVKKKFSWEKMADLISGTPGKSS